MCHHKLISDGDVRKQLLYGVQIEDPKVLIPWGICVNDLVSMFQYYNLSQVTEEYYYVENISFIGEKCNMGIYFKQTLYKIAFWRDDYQGRDDYIKSFNNFQSALEKVFGQPTEQKQVLIDFENCVWYIGENITIQHFVLDRFGLEENLYIEHL